MTQKINTYGIVGSGKLASHLQHYLSLSGLDVRQWARRFHLASDLPIVLNDCNIILILISDDAIESFIDAHWDFLKDRIAVHGSGALVTKRAQGIHFLNTFGKSFYLQDVYERTPIILERGKYKFKDIFPTLKNPRFEIAPEKKALYHALCVMGGNFTTLLWQKVFKEFESKLNLPKSAAFAYLQQVTNNLIQNSDGALTGPIARGDLGTIEKHLNALKEDPFEKVYQSFVEANLVIRS